MVIMHLSRENFTLEKQQISLYLTMMLLTMLHQAAKDEIQHRPRGVEIAKKYQPWGK